MTPVRRAVVDTVQWRLVAFVVDAAAFWLLTGSPRAAATGAVGLLAVKTGVFFVWRTWRETR